MIKKSLILLQKFINSRYFFPVVLLILIIPTFSFLLQPGMYWNMHDDMQMIRQFEMEKCFQDRQIPCRWAPDVGYGYGLPLFNYYPPLPYLIGQTFRFLGLSFVATIRYTAILQIILSSFFMYLLASSLFGPIGGLLSALFYTYAPYHAINIFVRGAMNEAWAATFFPLIFLFSKKLIETQKTKYLILLAISFSLLLLSHNPMVLIFSPLLVIWSLYWIYNQKFKKNISYLLIFRDLIFSAILSLGLSAFFTLPVLFETKLVQVDKMFSGYYSYFNHFASLFQLFISNFWGDGSSIWGPNDGLSFSVGYLHWIIPTIIFFIILIKYFKRHHLSSLEISVLGLVVMAFFTAFMVHERSTFIWKILVPLQKIQFPWRFLNITEFLFSLSVGIFPILLIKHSKLNLQNYFCLLLIIVLMIIINFKHFTPLTFGPLTDQQKFNGLAWTNQISGGINDYLPTTSNSLPQQPAKDYLDEIIPDSSKYIISGQKKGSDWQFFNLNLNKPSTVYLSVLAFPNFQITDNQQSIIYQIEPTLGRISLNLDAGQHQIYLKLINTPLRTFANYISLFSFFVFIYLVLSLKWKKST